MAAAGTTAAAGLDAHSQLVIEVRTLMKERDVHRDKGDFGKSDAVREKLSSLGVVIKDQVGGPSGWKFIDGRPNKLPAGVKQNLIPVAAQKTRAPAPEAVGGGKRGRDEQGGDKSGAKKAKAAAAASAEQSGSKGDKGDKGEKSKKPQAAEAPRKQSAEEQRNKAALAAVGGSGKGRNVNGVLIEVLKEGSGTRQAENGQRVKMGYVGRLTNGKVFDASGQKPFVFKLGRSEVIAGWDIGVHKMKVGEKRRLTIPPEKGYGRSGAPPTIPGNATLVFEVTLQDIM